MQTTWRPRRPPHELPDSAVARGARWHRPHRAHRTAPARSHPHRMPWRRSRSAGSAHPRPRRQDGAAQTRRAPGRGAGLESHRPGRKRHLHCGRGGVQRRARHHHRARAQCGSDRQGAHAARTQLAQHHAGCSAQHTGWRARADAARGRGAGTHQAYPSRPGQRERHESAHPLGPPIRCGGNGEGWCVGVRADRRRHHGDRQTAADCRPDATRW